MIDRRFWLLLLLAIATLAALLWTAAQGQRQHRDEVVQRHLERLLDELRQPLLRTLQREEERSPALDALDAMSLRSLEEDPLLVGWVVISANGVSSPHRRHGEAEAQLLQLRGGPVSQELHEFLRWAEQNLAQRHADMAAQLPRVSRVFAGEPTLHAGRMAIAPIAGRLLLLRRVEDTQGQILVLAAALRQEHLRDQAQAQAEQLHPQLTVCVQPPHATSDEPLWTGQRLPATFSRQHLECPLLGLRWQWTPALADTLAGTAQVRHAWLTAVLLAVLAALLSAVLLWRSMRQVARERAFVAAASHELRTPAAALRALTENIEGGVVTGGERLTRYHQAMANESRRLSGLVDNLLDQSRLQRAQLQVHPRPGVVPEVCRAAAAAAGLPSAAVDLDNEAAAAATADPEALRRMLDNLFDNARKYAPGATVRLRVQRRERSLEIAVIDTGPGIDHHHRRRVLRPWRRAPGHDHRPGLGLGLHLVQALAQAHGGHLRLEDAQPGCAAIICLPMDRKPEPAGE